MHEHRPSKTNIKPAIDRCGHDSFLTEFKHGEPTGNYICAGCGRHLSEILQTSDAQMSYPPVHSLK